MCGFVVSAWRATFSAARFAFLLPRCVAPLVLLFMLMLLSLLLSFVLVFSIAVVIGCYCYSYRCCYDHGCDS